MNDLENATAVVIYEDRPSHEIGVRLLVLSLQSHFPRANVHLFLPNATAEFQQWIRQFPATLHQTLETQQVGWNVKPSALRWALAQGYSQAIWIDSDIILSRPLPKALLNQPDDVLIASQLRRGARVRTHLRTQAWGFQPGRRFLRDPSSCCMRVTQQHRSFLNQWILLLEDPEYQYWQSRPFNDRPLHARTDDDLITALLGAKDWEQLPLHLLRSGRDIAQCLAPSDYGVDERLMSLIYGLPPLIHAIGTKPWLATGKQRVYQVLSPYACVARQYIGALGADYQWLDLPKNLARVWHDLVNQHPALASLPFALQDQIQKVGIREFINTMRYQLSGG